MLERTTWRLLLFFGFSFLYSLFLYGFVILLANDPIPPYVVNNTLSKTDSKLDHIIKLKNVCSSIFSRKRTSRKNITFLVSSIDYKPYITGNSDTGKKTRSSLKINRHVGSIRPKPTSLYSNTNRNYSVTIFSERFTLPTKAGSVSYKNTYPRKRRSSLLRFSQDRTRPTTAVPWAEDKSDNVTASDSNFTEDYSILTNQVPTTVSTNLQGSFEIGSSFVIISRLLPYEGCWFTNLYRYERGDWLVCLQLLIPREQRFLRLLHVIQSNYIKLYDVPVIHYILVKTKEMRAMQRFA